MKQRILGVCICCALMLLLSIPAYATDTTEYTLNKLGLTVSMPTDYIVFTRDINANDPNLSAYGLTKDSLSSLMNSRSIYLGGWDENVNNEINITMFDSPFVDYNLYSGTTLSAIATSFEPIYENAGLTAIKSEIYQHSQAKFLKIYVSQSNGDSTAYGLQYHTVYADKAINITMTCYSGQISSSNEAALKNIIDSVAFDTAPQVAESDFIPTNAFKFTDSKTQTTFTVPANWVEGELSKERKYISAKFISNEEMGLSIYYGSVDAFEKLPELSDSGLPRSAVNMKLFNTELSSEEIIEMFAEMYGGIASDFSYVTYGENAYYAVQVTDTVEAYGIEFKPTITQLFCVDNGYFYCFAFYGTSDNDYYDEFEALLTSVIFSNQGNGTSNSKSDDTGLMSGFSFSSILFSLLVTIALYSLPIIIYRYSVMKAPLGVKKAKKITIIYGICAFIVMSILKFETNGSGAVGGAVWLWSYINYRILIGGRKPQVNSEKVPIEENESAVVGQQ